MSGPSIDCRPEATDHLLKAVIALLSLRDPDFLLQLDKVLALAAAHDSPIREMTPEAWGEIRKEIGVIHRFVHGEDEPDGTPARELKISH